MGVGAATVIGSGRIERVASETPGIAAEKVVQAAPGVGKSEPSVQAGHGVSGRNLRRGGHGGEGRDNSLHPRIQFFKNISLIRGHLLVGGELVAAGLWDDALPHFHHPIEELYSGLAPRLKDHGLRPFDNALKALAQTVQAKNSTAYANALRTVTLRLTEVEQTMTKRIVDDPVQTRTATILAVLNSAAAEYKDAINGDQIVKPIEYQDSRGFVFYAEQMLKDAAEDLGKKDDAAFIAIRDAIAALKSAWPAPVPPRTSIADPEEVSSAVARIATAAAPLLRN